MTTVTRWRPPGPAKHEHQPLPEPPRTRRVSKVSRERKDRVAREMEEWLSHLTIARTHDGD